METGGTGWKYVNHSPLSFALSLTHVASLKYYLFLGTLQTLHDTNNKNHGERNTWTTSVTISWARTLSSVCTEQTLQISCRLLP